MAYEQNEGSYERQEYEVDEKCADCGTEIKKLPFKPDPARSNQLRCRDCYRQKRNSFQGGGQ